MSNRKCLLPMFSLLLLCALAFTACALGEADPAARNIFKPYISKQPQSYSFYNSAEGVSAALAYSPATHPTLRVEIWDWDSNDGNLSYQWYSFTTIEQYCENGGTEIEGATSSSYTPPAYTGEQITDGNQYFYYVVITNYNSKALDYPEERTRSEIAVVSFTNPGNPLIPIIVRNPVDALYGWGSPINSLQVKATAADGGTLSYQWYTSDVYSVSAAGGTPVSGGTQSMYMPNPATLSLGENYFYVIVTNTLPTLQNVRASRISIPAVITIEPGKKASAPRINEQPKDQLCFFNGTINALTLKAVSLDMGELTCQWYKNTSASVKNGTVVTGTDGAVGTPVTSANGETTFSFTPSVSNTTANVFFYYAVITNTNDNVVDQNATTATTFSKPVKLQIAASASSAANAFFTIPNPNASHIEGPAGEEYEVSNKYQYIRGYGGMDVAWGNFPETNMEDTELMYDPERLGYNMLRIMIKADYVDPVDTIQMLLTGDRPNYFENVKIVNKYGGYVEASPWTPPKDWKSNNSINGGGNLLPPYYKLFANYLRKFAQYMYDQGAPIYAISISNEPNYVAGYDGCEWEEEEMRDFFVEVGHFTNGIRGFGGGRETPYVLTVNGESANTPNINLPALRDPRSKAAIDVLARHIYGSRTDSLWNNQKSLITKKDANGNDVMMEVWMTEHNINSANATGYYNDSKWNYVWRYLNDVDLVIRMNNENAFVWWASKRFYSMISDGQFGTPNPEPPNKGGVGPTALPRGWALSHYSRYTIDHTRIHLELTEGKNSTTQNGTAIPNIEWNTSVVNKNVDDMDNTSPRITAFLAPDGNSISMVLWTPTKIGSEGYDMGTIEVTLPFAVQGVSAHRSTSDDDLFQAYDGITISSDRTKAYITLGRGQIISAKFSK